MESATYPGRDGRKPIEVIQAGLRKRKAAETRFKIYGIAAIASGLLFLAILFTTIVSNAYTAFVQTHIKLDVYLDPQVLEPEGKSDTETLSTADYASIVRASLFKLFPNVESRRDLRELNTLVGRSASFELRRRVLDDPGLVGKTVSLWLPAGDDVDMLLKGHIARTGPEESRPA